MTSIIVLLFMPYKIFQKLDDNKRAEYDKKSYCSFVNSRIGHLNLMFPRFLLFVLNLNKDTQRNHTVQLIQKAFQKGSNCKTLGLLNRWAIATRHKGVKENYNARTLRLMLDYLIVCWSGVLNMCLWFFLDLLNN